MSKHVTAAVLILILGVALILGYRFAQPLLRDLEQRMSSDAGEVKATLRVGVDNWIGYFPLCSQRLAQRLRREGIALRCIEDRADYRERLAALSRGELELAVATVDAYLKNGAALDYPASIIAVLDESAGGDALVAVRDQASTLDQLKAKPELKIAYTAGSPSEHLLRSVSAHFGLPQWANRSSRVEVDGSSAALAQLRRGDVAAAVLWEPDVSSALADPRYVKLIGTDETERLIVDVLLASRNQVTAQPELIQAVISAYFETLEDYLEQPEQLAADVRSERELDSAQVSAMLAGVRFANLADNAKLWFGSGARQEALVRAIDSTVRVLVTTGALDSNPLPDGDPYRLTNRQFVAAIERNATTRSTAGAASFAELDDAGWARLVEIATLRLETIGFQRGTSLLDSDAEDALKLIAERLAHYPRHRLLVKGHTSTRGDSAANLELSAQRARAVVEHLIAVHGLDPNRLRAVGYGGSRPLPREPDESNRAYDYRLPRVEFALLSEPL